ncbi:MAG TPA: hypothetical protein VKU41_31395 [Polyangiaceae bacterium]|nr:hypothetical protein [Polyangiaceae bacterium]
MHHLVRLGAGIALAVGAAAAVAVASCSSSGSAGLDQTCSINSDCNGNLICAFGRCHNECKQSRDCATGERCVLSGTTGVCQLPEEATCAKTSCQVGQVCGNDQQCRTTCMSTSDCTMGDFCLAGSGTMSACYSPGNAADQPALIAAGDIGVDGAVLGDGAAGMPHSDASSGSPEGGSASPESGSGSPDATVDAGMDAPAGNSCPSAQTQFGNMATGDSNPNFTGGVGARTATSVLAFSGYAGPAAGGVDGGANVGLIYVQAFDPGTGTEQGPAAPLFQVKNLNTTGHDAPLTISLYASAIAPSGEVVLVYGVRFYLGGAYDETDMFAAFLSPSADGGAGGEGGAAGLQLARNVLLETAQYQGYQPQAIWAPPSQSFVLSWTYYTSQVWAVRLKKFLRSGLAAGGDTDIVPTNDPAGSVYSNRENGSAGVSGNAFGVAYTSGNPATAVPWFTLLDSVSNPIGPTVNVSSTSGNWVAVGGTAQGFTYFYDDNANSTVQEAFLTAGDAGVVGGPMDGGDAGFPGFRFTGAPRAVSGRAIDDDQGKGGVGLVLLNPTDVAFAYVNVDGMGHQGPISVFPHNYVSGDMASMTNLGGSFVVSLWDQNGHSTRVAASGCVP